VITAVCITALRSGTRLLGLMFVVTLNLYDGI
jgi:hypothetical protein